MTIEPVDPLDLDAATAERCAAIINRDWATHVSTQAPWTGPNFAALARFTHDDRPFDHMWLARVGDDLVGYASVDFPRWDNPHMALVICHVDPDHQGRGIGTALLEAQVDATRSAGRSMLLTYGFLDSPVQKLLTLQGFEVAMTSAQRRLRPAELNYTLIQRYADEAAAHATDYELIRLAGAAPSDWLPELTSLFESISDAPLEGMDLTDDVFPVERIERLERAMANRQQKLYRLMARHKSSGEWAGHTIVCVDGHRPGLAFQEDTTVVGSHRGHRLGMLLKASMLLWLREAHPELEIIDTFNAESNKHMIAINDKLGCTISARGCALQRHLDVDDR